MLTVKCVKQEFSVKALLPDGMVVYFNKSHATCPDYRNKYLNVNCNRYKIQWLK